MIGLSQTTGYAIQALACLESLGPQPCFIRDVAECTGVPRPYLAHIVNRLARQGIVTAKRGYRGGIALQREARTISLLEIVEAVEGDEWICPCLLGIEKCSDGFVCPTRDFWFDIQEQIEAKLRSTTLAEVIASARPAKARGRKCGPARSKPLAPSRMGRGPVGSSPGVGGPG